MTTKQRFRNKYRLELRENDHGPMHVHFVGGDINAKIDLLTLDCVAGAIPSCQFEKRSFNVAARKSNRHD